MRAPDRGGTPPSRRPVKVTRCALYWICRALVPHWRNVCWRHDCEQRQGWPPA